MIVVMKANATRGQIVNVTARIEGMGCQAHISEGQERTIIGIIGNGRPLDREQLERLDGVDRAVPVLRPFKLSSRDFHPQDTVVPINGVAVGGKKLMIMAGPCAVEDEAQILAAARAVRDAGAHMLRGGAFKPRSSPYSFQGLGEEGLKLLALAARRRACPSSRRSLPPNRYPSSRPMPTCCRSAPATCRTMRCSTPWANRSGRCC